VKDAGLYRQMGKDYEGEEGDFCFSKLNVSRGGKKK